jgi:hypothetical protein
MKPGVNDADAGESAVRSVAFRKLVVPSIGKYWYLRREWIRSERWTELCGPDVIELEMRVRHENLRGLSIKY